MPARVETTSAIGTAPAACDVYDMDNIFLTDEGWVYRHYKKADKSQFWDEILVAGEVVSGATIGGVANDPVDSINDASPTFEVGDGTVDFENSPLYGDGGGGTPAPDPSTSIGAVTVSGDTSANDGDSKTYTVDTSNATASGLTYTWTADDDAAINGGATGASVTVDITYSSGSATVTCVVGSNDANFDGNAATDSIAIATSA